MGGVRLLVLARHIIKGHQIRNQLSSRSLPNTFFASSFHSRRDFNMSATTTVTVTETNTSRAAAAAAAFATIDLAGYDAEQARLMDERCILVDEEDRPLGAADKKTCECSRPCH